MRENYDAFEKLPGDFELRGEVVLAGSEIHYTDRVYSYATYRTQNLNRSRL